MKLKHVARFRRVGVGKILGCRPFVRAFHSGTDSEGFGPAMMAHDGWIMLGSIAETVTHCPWCGAKIEVKEEED